MNASTWLYWTTGVLVFVLLSVGLVIEHADSYSYALLALLGIATFRMSRPRSFSRQEKTLFILLGIFFAVSLLSWLVNDLTYFGWKRLGRQARLLMAIPIIYLFIRARLTQGWFWYSIAAGAIVAGAAGMVELWLANSPMYRIEGESDPISYGNHALVMAFIALAGFGWFRNRGRWQTVIPILAIALGLMASLLSGSRGGWMALPALLILFLWFFRHKLNPWRSSLLLASLVAVAVILFAAPQTDVQRRYHSALQDIEVCVQDGECTSSIGQRLMMWNVAWEVFLERPLLGQGQYAFHSRYEARIESGVLPKVWAYTDPHSEYLWVLASRGIVGLLSLGLLLFGAGWIFLQATRSHSPDVPRVGLAGLALTITLLFAGLTISVFYDARDLNFYGFLFGSLVYLISHLAASRSENTGFKTVAADR